MSLDSEKRGRPLGPDRHAQGFHVELAVLLLSPVASKLRKLSVFSDVTPTQSCSTLDGRVMWARGILLALGSDACISQRSPASGSSEASSKSSSASTLSSQDGGDWMVGVLPSEVTLKSPAGTCA